MLMRLAGAATRAFFVMILVATPSLIIPGVTVDTTQVAALIGFIGAAMVLSEYMTAYPILIEFRDAPPYNRTRVLLLFLTVLLLSVLFKAAYEPTIRSELIVRLADRAMSGFDFPFSPVRFSDYLLGEDATALQASLMRDSAAIALGLGILTLALFVVLIRIIRWPSRGTPFNVWVNLPTFDPTSGGDVVRRLNRTALLNAAAGLGLLYFFPVALGATADALESLDLTDGQTMIWAVSFWYFIPTSLLMRSIALRRIAAMISERRNANAEAEASDSPVA